MSARPDAARRALASSGVLAFVDAVRRPRLVEGMKTEPALCRALGIAGDDPYEDLLAMESWSDARLRGALVAGVGGAPPGGDGG